MVVMVREYILTDRERVILREFLKSGTKLNGFSVLIHLLKHARPRIIKDMELIDSVFEKLQG